MFKAWMPVRKILHFTDVKMISYLHVRHHLAGLQPPAVCRSSSSVKQAPLLTAAPVRALIDDQISITARFLPPSSPVTVCTRMHSEDGDLWEAFAHYNTDTSGTVNLTSDPSAGGSYLGCEPMGLFWGLQPAPGGREGLRLRKRNVQTPYVVRISLLEGHVSPCMRDISELAAVTTERWYMAPGVRRSDIRQNGVVGSLFLPPGPGPYPALLDLWGMGGGLVEYRSALLASRGYASLSVAYIGHKDLPPPQNRLNVGDEYFKAAFKLLQDHCEVDADRIGIFGLSFGVFLSLRIATQLGLNPSCLILVNGPVGSTVALPDMEDHFLTFEKSQEYWTYDKQGNVIFKDVSLPSNIAPERKAKVENINCPVMYIVGEDDLSSSSKENADVIEETLRSAGKSQLFTRLSYPGAGHLIEPPYSPNARVSFWSIKPEKLMTVWGGHPAPHAAAQEDAWKKVLKFMESHLRSVTGVR
uniref:Acyl-coenzyme A thioesterase 1-like n=1 Tax=Gouania willdenowi TaxID=441366 RepID=A0A8C5EWU3_GOUWI